MSPAKYQTGRLTRRGFLGGAAAAMAMPVAALPAKPRITDGVASGDVTDTGAVIWSRCDRPAHGRRRVDDGGERAQVMEGAREVAAPSASAQDRLLGFSGRTP